VSIVAEWREKRDVDRPAGRGSVTYIPLLLSPMEWKGTTSGGVSQESQLFFFFFFFFFFLGFTFGDERMGDEEERGGRAHSL
jgi:hypothetical protein